jgi:HK97 family phage portal protein
MKWYQRFFRKESQARMAVAINQIGQPVSSPRSFTSYSNEGYQKNVVVYRCIQIIAKACAGIEWELYQKRTGGKAIEVENHPILDLISRPNPIQAQAAFFEAMVAYYCLTGNSYVEAQRLGNAPPLELWTVMPDKMQIVPDGKGYPSKYVFKAGSNMKAWDVDPITLKGNILHMKTFHPTDIWFGMSPLSAGMMSLDQNNQASKWNLATLQNSAVPSGILQVKSSDVNPEGTLSEEQFGRLTSELDSRSGASSAGRPWVLEGNLEWKQISLSPKDMEFINNKQVTAIDICQAFGVPPEMIGLGQKTFNNYKEARKSFYQETVLPIMDVIQSEFNSWLIPMFDKNKTLVLKYDKDDIEALQIDRKEKFDMVNSATYLTQNEKRHATGYEEKEGWDVFLIGNMFYSNPEDNSYEDTQSTETNPPEPPAPPPKTGSSGENEDDQKSISQPEEWKTFNLLNNNEKQTAWKRQNWKRGRLEAGFRRDLESDFKELSNDVSRALKSSNDPKVLEFALTKTVDENIGTIKKTLDRHIKYAVNDFGQNTLRDAKRAFGQLETKSEKQWEDWARQWTKKRSSEAIKQIEGTTQKQINSIMKRVRESLIEGTSVDEIASEISNDFASIGKSRATLIARTEVGMASANSTIEAVRSLKVPNMMKEWVSSEDDRTRDGEKGGPDHLTMNGEQVPLEDVFTVPPDYKMDGPGDEVGGPENVCNCRCVLVFKSKNEIDV